MAQELLQNIKGEIGAWLSKAGVANPVVLLERAAMAEFGEYSSNAAMRYARELGNCPLELADQLADFLSNQNITGLERAESVKPGFVNLYLTPAAKLQHIESIINAKVNFGKNQSHHGEKWVIEHTSPNPNKAMHIGHLRINLIGMGIVRLLQHAGAEVIADGIYNDRGISIAKVMYGYLVHMKKDANVPTDIGYWAQHQNDWFTPEEKGMKPDEFVSECYVLGERDFTDSDEVETIVRQMVIDWEAHNEIVWKLWRHVLQYAYLGNERVLNRLGSHWDKVWYEHEHYQAGKLHVEHGLQTGVFKQLADGAVITDLEETYGLPDTVVLKRDGTSLYITQDIALTDLKKKTYNADKLVWVIGPEQSLAMKQLFAVCEQLGFGKLSDFTHVSYGNVGLRNETGGVAKMSSRSGKVVLADDVIDVVKATIKTRFESEGKHEESVQNELAEKLALAAVKFGFLKPDKMQDIAFDIEQSVDVQGDSGMYVMYTYVRTQSILRKAGTTMAKPFSVPDKLGSEAALVRSLLYFEDVVQKSIDDLSVHHVAQYLLELSSEFNRWYAKETILDGNEQEPYKLKIVEATGIALQNGLEILGINTVSEM